MAKFNTELDVSMINNIKNYIKNNQNKLELASVGDGNHSTKDKNIRNCLTYSIEKNYWIVRLLESYIQEVNRDIFQFDLNGWGGDLQYLLYEGKGTGYVWHSDSQSMPTENGVRKLSLVLGLSKISEYDGGEFQIILNGNKDMRTIKLDLGDCIIFPSTSIHRVRPLKSGKRETIVGWYAGPEFR